MNYKFGVLSYIITSHGKCQKLGAGTQDINSIDNGMGGGGLVQDIQTVTLR